MTIPEVVISGGASGGAVVPLGGSAPQPVTSHRARSLTCSSGAPAHRPAAPTELAAGKEARPWTS
jgi:hypothetical protein